MSIQITPYPTASYMQLAMQNPGSVSIDAHYIGVGEGLQDVEGSLDDAGRATIDTLKKPVAWLPILKAKKITGYQHQMVVDFSGVLGREWNFSECCLADANKKAIAIYGNKSQALQTVSDQVDVALVAINMVLASFPANSINIIHKGASIELFMTRELLAMDAAIGGLTLSQMRSHDARILKEKEEMNRRAVWEKRQHEKQLQHEISVNQLLVQLRGLVDQNKSNQRVFNHEVEQAVGGLSLTLIQ